MMLQQFKVLWLTVLVSAFLIQCANETASTQKSTSTSEAEAIETAQTSPISAAATPPEAPITTPDPSEIKAVEPTVNKTETKASAQPSKKAIPPPAPTPIPEKAKETPVVETVEVETEVVPVVQKKVKKKADAVVEKPRQKGPDHANWDAFLRKNVSSTGVVKYAAIHANQAALQTYLDDLSAHPPQSDWTRKEKMAYWINAYNAFTIKRIIDNYPLRSIMDLDGGKTWDVKWIQLGDKTYSLNQIENDILRPQFGDARIHFAVNCAAKSCPPLLNRAFTAQNLNSTLASQTKKFIGNEAFTSITETTAEVSKIFEWYAVDFGDLRTFLNRNSTTKLTEGATISYKDYDWSLNGK